MPVVGKRFGSFSTRIPIKHQVFVLEQQRYISCSTLARCRHDWLAIAQRTTALQFLPAPSTLVGTCAFVSVVPACYWTPDDYVCRERSLKTYSTCPWATCALRRRARRRAMQVDSHPPRHRYCGPGAHTTHTVPTACLRLHCLRPTLTYLVQLRRPRRLLDLPGQLHIQLPADTSLRLPTHCPRQVHRPLAAAIGRHPA